MSIYTTQVRFLCEHFAEEEESSEYFSIDEILDRAIPVIFNFSFPIFDEEYRNVLCKKILKHYYTREIGLETYGLWKLKLDTKLNEIMPYYNQLYKSELLEFNPFHDVDIDRTSTRDGTYDKDTIVNNTNSNTLTHTGQIDTTSDSSESTASEQTSDESGTSKSKELFSDTPQGQLTDVEEGNYLTTAKFTDGESSGESNTVASGATESNTGSKEVSAKTDVNFGNDSSTGTSISSSFDEYVENVKGKQGSQSYSSLLQEFRKSFLNIDMQIIADLSDLFMNIYE